MASISPIHQVSLDTTLEGGLGLPFPPTTKGTAGQSGAVRPMTAQGKRLRQNEPSQPISQLNVNSHTKKQHFVDEDVVTAATK